MKATLISGLACALGHHRIIGMALLGDRIDLLAQCDGSRPAVDAQLGIWRSLIQRHVLSSIHQTDRGFDAGPRKRSSIAEPTQP
jgi:hypothetical protein